MRKSQAVQFLSQATMMGNGGNGGLASSAQNSVFVKVVIVGGLTYSSLVL